MQVLSLVNQKGGCGKTTVAVNLAGVLAARGVRALLVDLDPQGHATLALGAAPEDGAGGPRDGAIGPRDLTVCDVLLGEARIEDALVAAAGGVWLLPATARLAEFEERSARAMEPEQSLVRALAGAEDSFDVVVLDCPPRADGVLTKNALRASTTALLVVETGAFALQGAIAAARILAEVEREGQKFDLRVVATMFDRRQKLAREILIALQARFGDALFDTVIRHNLRLREAAALGAPVAVIDPGGLAAADFGALADEVLAMASSPVSPARSVPPVHSGEARLLRAALA
jgi:chromosome partitioning protein